MRLTGSWCGGLGPATRPMPAADSCQLARLSAWRRLSGLGQSRSPLVIGVPRRQQPVEKRLLRGPALHCADATAWRVARAVAIRTRARTSLLPSFAVELRAQFGKEHGSKWPRGPDSFFL